MATIPASHSNPSSQPNHPPDLSKLPLRNGIAIGMAKQKLHVTKGVGEGPKRPKGGRRPAELNESLNKICDSPNWPGCNRIECTSHHRMEATEREQTDWIAGGPNPVIKPAECHPENPNPNPKSWRDHQRFCKELKSGTRAHQRIGVDG